MTDLKLPITWESISCNDQQCFRSDRQAELQGPYRYGWPQSIILTTYNKKYSLSSGYYKLMQIQTYVKLSFIKALRN